MLLNSVLYVKRRMLAKLLLLIFVEAPLNAIMKEDADFYGVLLINEHGNAADKSHSVLYEMRCIQNNFYQIDRKNSPFKTGRC